MYGTLIGVAELAPHLEDPDWVRISPPDVALRNFTAVDPFPPDPVTAFLTGDDSPPTRLLGVSTTGQVWDITFPEGQPPRWERNACFYSL